jgi:hypothetical protein
MAVNYSPNGKELVVIQGFQHFSMVGSDNLPGTPELKTSRRFILIHHCL